MAGMTATLQFQGQIFTGGYVEINTCNYSKAVGGFIIGLRWWLTKEAHDQGLPDVYSDGFPVMPTLPDVPNSNPIDNALVELQEWFPTGVPDR